MKKIGASLVVALAVSASAGCQSGGGAPVPPQNVTPDMCAGDCQGNGEGWFTLEKPCSADAVAAAGIELAAARSRAQQQARRAAAMSCWARGGGNCQCGGGQLTETDVKAEDYAGLTDPPSLEKAGPAICMVTVTYQYQGGTCSAWQPLPQGANNPTPACVGTVDGDGTGVAQLNEICSSPCAANTAAFDHARNWARYSARQDANRLCQSAGSEACLAVAGQDVARNETCSTPPGPSGEPRCQYEANRALLRAPCVFVF